VARLVTRASRTTTPGELQCAAFVRGEIDRSHSGPPVALPKGMRVIGKGPFTAIFVAWFVALMA
jgi:hypothetical protein